MIKNLKWFFHGALILVVLVNYASAYSNVEDLKDNPLFIATKGKLPDTIDQEWKNTIRDCWLNITTQIGPSYSEFGSSINSIGVGNEMLNVYLNSDFEAQINDSGIDGIYQKIESCCEENCGITDVPVVFLWDGDDEDLLLPDYGPEIFEKAENSSDFVAAKGIMPVITEEGKKREWTDLLVQCSHANDKIINYFTSYGGPVVSFGTNINGYLKVGLNSATSEKVNDSVIDEIYLTIDEAAKEEGVSNAPVVFIWSGIPQNDLEVLDGPPASEDDLENESTQNEESTPMKKNSFQIMNSSIENETTENEEESPQNISGFTSTLLVLCLLILVKMRS